MLPRELAEGMRSVALLSPATWLIVVLVALVAVGFLAQSPVPEPVTIELSPDDRSAAP